jgi:hypothetical protein
MHTLMNPAIQWPQPLAQMGLMEMQPLEPLEKESQSQYLGLMLLVELLVLLALPA